MAKSHASMSDLVFNAYEFLEQDDATGLYMPVIIESTFGKYRKPQKAYLIDFYVYLAELHKKHYLWDGSENLTNREVGKHLCKYKTTIRRDCLPTKIVGSITVTVYKTWMDL